MPRRQKKIIYTQKKNKGRGGPPPLYSVPVKKQSSLVEIIVIVFVFFLVSIGMTFLFFEERIKNLFPDLKTNDIDDIPNDTGTPTGTPTGTQTGTPQTSTKNKNKTKESSGDAIYYIAVGFGSLFILSLIGLAVGHVLKTQKENNPFKGGYLTNYISHGVISEFVETFREVIYASTPVVSLVVLGAVSHKLRWSTARDWLLGFAFFFFFFFVVRVSVTKTYYKRKTSFLIAVPASICLLLGLFFSYMGETYMATIMYMFAVGAYASSVLYFRYLEMDLERSNWFWSFFGFPPETREERGKSKETSYTEQASRQLEAVQTYLGSTRVGQGVIKGIEWWNSSGTAETQEEQKEKEKGLLDSIKEYVYGAGGTEEEVKEAEKKTKEVLKQEEEYPGYIARFVSSATESLYGTGEQKKGQDQQEQTWTEYLFSFFEENQETPENSSEDKQQEPKK